MSNDELRLAIARFQGAERAIQELLAQGGQLREVGEGLRAAVVELRNGREDVRRLAAALEVEAKGMAVAAEAIQRLDPPAIRRELEAVVGNLDRVRTRMDQIAGEQNAQLAGVGGKLAVLVREEGDRLIAELGRLGVDVASQESNTRIWLVGSLILWVGLVVVLLVQLFGR